MGNSNYNGEERRRSYIKPDNDHDLLINIHNKVNNLVDQSEEQKEERDLKHEDHEKRIRWLEKSIMIGMGGLFMLQFLFKFIIK